MRWILQGRDRDRGYVTCIDPAPRVGTEGAGDQALLGNGRGELEQHLKQVSRPQTRDGYFGAGGNAALGLAKPAQGAGTTHLWIGADAGELHEPIDPGSLGRIGDLEMGFGNV